MTFRCQFTRKSLAIAAGVMGGATLLITVIVAGVLVANKKLEANDTDGIRPHPDQLSALLSDMYCFAYRSPNRNPKQGDDELWPLTGPVVPECDGKFSIDTFDDEQVAGAALVAQNHGNNNSSGKSPLVLPTEKEIAQKGHYSGKWFVKG